MLYGPVAQSGERRPRMAEVRGSSPLGSTPQFPYLCEKRDKAREPRHDGRGLLLQPYCNPDSSEGISHRAGSLIPHGGQVVRIGIECHGYGGVSEELLHELGMYAPT